MGVAALGAQLATARASFGLQGASGTLVVVFLRGGMDGLSALVPADDPHLAAARPRIAVPAGALLPLDRGFGLHPALAPLHDLWGRGLFTAVPAVSTPDISRSHFQAQDCLERGGSSAGASRAGSTGPWTSWAPAPRSGPHRRHDRDPVVAGDQSAMSLAASTPSSCSGEGELHERTSQALAALYTGLDHPLAADTAATLDGLGAAALVRRRRRAPPPPTPAASSRNGLAEIARLIKADVGLRVACVDMGGWDTHTSQGTVDGGPMTASCDAREHARCLRHRHRRPHRPGQRRGHDRVRSPGRAERQRRTDHGHGAAVLLLGGGLAGGTVHGVWNGLAPDGLDQGDVPGWTDYRDVLADVVTARLGIGAGDLPTVFPGHRPQPVGVMA